MKKLALSKETIRNLDENSLRQVNGGETDGNGDGYGSPDGPDWLTVKGKCCPTAVPCTVVDC